MKLTYIRVEWKHSHSDEPILLYSEIDDQRWEKRKVEIFANGKRGYATLSEAVGGTHLGELPIPLLQEISKDPQFEPSEIQKEEFEAIWEERKSG
jgi:hypothetical protein